jgi:hypothetical protein
MSKAKIKSANVGFEKLSESSCKLNHKCLGENWMIMLDSIGFCDFLKLKQIEVGLQQHCNLLR